MLAALGADAGRDGSAPLRIAPLRPYSAPHAPGCLGRLRPYHSWTGAAHADGAIAVASARPLTYSRLTSSIRGACLGIEALSGRNKDFNLPNTK
jgi:hypothetical protein